MVPSKKRCLLEEEHFICEWEVCRQLFKNLDRFVEHVARHAEQVDVGSEGFIICLWEDCGFVTRDQEEIKRHINYHSYHTKLKNDGAKCVDQRGLQQCQLDRHTRNCLPSLGPFICLWVDCHSGFLKVQDFVVHLKQHATKGKCLWLKCTSQFPNKSKMVDHFKSHSQEKSVACPTCGTEFANPAKFENHCRRQLPQEG